MYSTWAETLELMLGQRVVWVGSFEDSDTHIADMGIGGGLGPLFLCFQRTIAVGLIITMLLGEYVPWPWGEFQLSLVVHITLETKYFQR